MTRDLFARPGAAAMVMLVTPLFFSTNLIFGRQIIGDVAPFTLALIRWGLVALALSPFLLREHAAARELLRSARWRVVFLGFLGMWICGGLVYFGLAYTTATNATLIYTTSPVFILLIAAVAMRRPIGPREALGSAMALLGIAWIVLRGHPETIIDLGLNAGDIIIVAGSVCWAVYSVMLRAPRFSAMSNLALLSLIAAAGALLLLPFAVAELVTGHPMPVTALAWRSIAGIVVFSSLLAFLRFQVGIRGLGAPTASVFMYLMPAYGVLMAVGFLGETFEGYHAVGIVLVMGGVILATLPASLFSRAGR